MFSLPREKENACFNEKYPSIQYEGCAGRAGVPKGAPRLQDSSVRRHTSAIAQGGPTQVPSLQSLPDPHGFFGLFSACRSDCARIAYIADCADYATLNSVTCFNKLHIFIYFPLFCLIRWLALLPAFLINVLSSYLSETCEIYLGFIFFWAIK